MNLRAAKNELGGPPKVGLLALVVETVGLVAVALVLVSLLG